MDTAQQMVQEFSAELSQRAERVGRIKLATEIISLMSTYEPGLDSPLRQVQLLQAIFEKCKAA